MNSYIKYIFDEPSATFKRRGASEQKQVLIPALTYVKEAMKLRSGAIVFPRNHKRMNSGKTQRYRFIFSVPALETPSTNVKDERHLRFAAGEENDSTPSDQSESSGHQRRGNREASRMRRFLFFA